MLEDRTHNRMDSEYFDLVARTRSTILEILKDRGYATEGLENQSMDELQKIALRQPQLLNMKVECMSETSAIHKFCHVIYVLDNIRLKLENYIESLFSEDTETPLHPDTDAIFLVLNEPVIEVFHAQAAKFWNRKKALLSFFHIKHLVSNPRRHVLVPPHRKLTEEEASEVMKKLYIRSKSEFKRILFHIDPQARLMGLLPGDLVEIRSPSQTCGEAIEHRVCSM